MSNKTLPASGDSIASDASGVMENGNLEKDQAASDRRIRARIAAYARHARCSGAEATSPARAAFLKQFETLVDPSGEMDPAERQRRAGIKRKEHMTRLALKSVESRRRKSSP